MRNEVVTGRDQRAITKYVMPPLAIKYRVTTINVSRKWIEWAEWAASLCTANSPFPGHVYCRHPVHTILFIDCGFISVRATIAFVNHNSQKFRILQVLSANICISSFSTG